MKKSVVLLLSLLCLGGFLYARNTRDTDECSYIHKTYLGTVVHVTDRSITIKDLIFRSRVFLLLWRADPLLGAESETGG